MKQRRRPSGKRKRECKEEKRQAITSTYEVSGFAGRMRRFVFHHCVDGRKHREDAPTQDPVVICIRVMNVFTLSPKQYLSTLTLLPTIRAIACQSSPSDLKPHPLCFY
ncbi:hypothetical protein Poly51_25010 [Rubripirellula tenax]|uniref:Uncharacterized protein n=1 Tax=Rubripirellula tenax TaxID=2528015 RepID=A0A5C6F5S9_9BACT|nr:hypothetical protein Poly51_25010 [Rubripirellula tenax]